MNNYPINRKVFVYPVEASKCTDKTSKHILYLITQKANQIACKDSLSDFSKLPINNRFMTHDERVLGYYIWRLHHYLKEGK